MDYNVTGTSNSGHHGTASQYQPVHGTMTPPYVFEEIVSRNHALIVHAVQFSLAR